MRDPRVAIALKVPQSVRDPHDAVALDVPQSGMMVVNGVVRIKHGCAKTGGNFCLPRLLERFAFGPSQYEP